MRLIDADKIDYIMEDEEKPNSLDYVRRSHIAEEPTVKAIPVEWLYQKRTLYLENKCYMSLMVINEIINWWEKENENN